MKKVLLILLLIFSLSICGCFELSSSDKSSSVISTISSDSEVISQGEDNEQKAAEYLKNCEDRKEFTDEEIIERAIDVLSLENNYVFWLFDDVFEYDKDDVIYLSFEIYNSHQDNYSSVTYPYAPTKDFNSIDDFIFKASEVYCDEYIKDMIYKYTGRTEPYTCAPLIIEVNDTLYKTIESNGVAYVYPPYIGGEVIEREGNEALVKLYVDPESDSYTDVEYSYAVFYCEGGVWKLEPRTYLSNLYQEYKDSN